MEKLNIKFPRAPWNHQNEAILRFRLAQHFALFWQVGTGKTLAAIGIVREKYFHYGEVVPTLIVTKAAVVWNWQREIAACSPESVANSVCVLYGEGKKKLTGAQRIALLKDETKKIFITNYDAFGIKGFPEALKAKNFKIIVCDESQAIKNPDSKRFKALLQVSDAATHRGVLTGTPILNNLLDIWAQYRFLDGGATFGKNFYVFRSMYFVDKNVGMPPGRYFPDWQVKPESPHIVSDKMEKTGSRKTKEECLDLPATVYMEELIDLSEDQRRLYDQMLKELVAYVKGVEATATNALVQVLRLLQIITGHLKLDSGEVVRPKGNPRLDRLRELLEEITPAHKVIVWTTFRETYKDIADLCTELKIGFTTITGETKDKQGSIDKFQTDESCRVVIANPKAGGVGIGLQASSYAIYYSRDFSLEARLQSEARNHRGGSEIHDKITYIDLIAKDTLDADVLAALRSKENFAENVLQRLQRASNSR